MFNDKALAEGEGDGFVIIILLHSLNNRGDVVLAWNGNFFSLVEDFGSLSNTFPPASSISVFKSVLVG